MSSISALSGTQVQSSHLKRQVPSRFATIQKQVHSFVSSLKEKVQVIWRKFWDLICSICCCKKEGPKIKRPTYFPPPQMEKRPIDVPRVPVESPQSIAPVQPKQKSKNSDSQHPIIQEMHELTRRPTSSPLEQELQLSTPQRRLTSKSETPLRGFQLLIKTPDSVVRLMVGFLPASDVTRFGRTSKFYNRVTLDDSVWRSLRQSVFPRVPLSPQEEQIPSHKKRYELLVLSRRRIKICNVPGRGEIRITYYSGITTMREYMQKLSDLTPLPPGSRLLVDRKFSRVDHLLCSQYFEDSIDRDGRVFVPDPNIHYVTRCNPIRNLLPIPIPSSIQNVVWIH